MRWRTLKSRLRYLENYEPLQPRRRERRGRIGQVRLSRVIYVCAQIGMRTSSILSDVFSGTAKTFTQRRAQAPMPTRCGSAQRWTWEGSRADNGPAHADHVTHDAAKNPEDRAERAGSWFRKGLCSQSSLHGRLFNHLGSKADRRPEAPRNAGSQAPDVQVHIGRIEVLAVQQQAPATLAPRRERTTSLADYLAGRNGRKP